MNYFFETYECKIDDKGRLKLPSPLAKHLETLQDERLIVKRAVFQNCLEVYTETPWKQLTARLNQLNRFKKRNTDFIRLFTAGVKSVEIDKSERILIPKDLKDFAQLSRDIVISGVGEFFEIWDKTAYEENIRLNENDFAEMAEEVMGNPDTEQV
ncbi:division/cell wall cluster transcriptional repressor MraZ [Riemerella columbina]|uniref:division/cell wall cluster transcriptional repressor MraZ n=1 Tax=Riemerella columbina TaxID=103810 RepID=UPI00266ED3FE|nr:division/cell wall cluster transcriptional repressor MraZ [Riemerella columbina]WKS95369.1 division/cell wall cluster transcriptional repressor MraZ [Riemerella columbina]